MSPFDNIINKRSKNVADQNRQQRKVTIEILNEAPVKGDSTWELTVWAIVKKGNDFLDGARVRFFCSNQQVGSDDTTDGGGRTNPFLIPVPAHKTSVQIEVLVDGDDGTITKRSKEILLPRPTAIDKRADEWSTRVVGSEGEYTAYVSVTGQNHLPLPRILIHVYFDRGAQLVGEKYTDDNGLAVIAIQKFTTPFKDIIIEAVGTRIKPEKKRLYRRHNQAPPPIPEPRDADQTSGLKGIFKAFLKGWQSGEQAKRDQNETR